MPLTKLQFRPGVNREVTSYSNEGGWRDCDKIRFRFGYPEKLGGWEKYSPSTYLGTARALHSWTTLDGSNLLGIGTNLKYYIEEGQVFNDITPLRQTTSAGDVTFSATNGSTTITATDANHGAQEGDFVTFSDTASLGGAITTARLNIEHQIVQVVDSNTYTFTAAVAANSSDTGNGGSSTVAAYQINVGLDDAIGGTGWGAGLYGGTTNTALSTTLNEGGLLSASDTTITVTSSTGIAASDTILIEEELITVGGVSGNDLTGCTRGVSGTTAATHVDGTVVRLATGNASTSSDFTGWGSAAAGGLTTTSQLRLWEHDNFGEDLIINAKDGGIYYWDKTTNVSSRAVELSTLSGTKTSVPQFAKQVIVSDQDRHVIAFGCDGLNASSSGNQGNGTQDPLLIRFSDQENPLIWYPAATNTAGDLRLGSGSRFVQALETKREILVWTDTALSSMRFIGPPFTFGIQQLASNITIMSPNAASSTEDFVFWMGIDNFYVYAGQTQQLPCSVKDKVFLDFNFDQSEKVVSGINSEFSEVFWFYPSASSSDNDRYVIYNYGEKVWYFGNLARTAWLDRGVRAFPLAAGNQYLYNHELGYDDDGSAMNSYIESSPMDIGDGDKFTYIGRVIPDITFDGSTNLSSPQATFTVKSRNFPGAGFDNTAAGDTIRTATSPVETFTNQLFLRSRGRSFALRVESSALGARWKLGSPRIDIRQDGRR
jgi:hypothetical protein